MSIADSVLGATLSPLLGVFFLAMFVPWANATGTLAGGITSAIINLWMMSGHVITDTKDITLPAPIYGCNVTLLKTIHANTDFGTGPLIRKEEKLNPFLEWAYSLSFLLYPVIGVTFTVIIGCIISLLTGGLNTEQVDQNLLICSVYCKAKPLEPEQAIANNPDNTGNKSGEEESINAASGCRNPEETDADIEGGREQTTEEIKEDQDQSGLLNAYV